ncbi:MAG: serine/threonine protein kinase [Sandaracinaceae bacterium]|nr:serine/threonine protein kinase [Sandaracinaceae bacterium]
MTERSELEPGTRIDGRYRIVGPLGEGGMGVVYRARDERLGRQVALKTLPAARVGDAQARARLVREARAAAALEHPGIAQVYDVGETEDGGAYLVMELVRGTSLRRAMAALSRDRILELLEQIAHALDHAHANGVIHRDIKPDNVMVRDDGRAVLLDFGLAKDVGVGTAETIAPDTPTVDADFATKEGCSSAPSPTSRPSRRGARTWGRAAISSRWPPPRTRRSSGGSRGTGPTPRRSSRRSSSTSRRRRAASTLRSRPRSIGCSRARSPSAPRSASRAPPRSCGPCASPSTSPPLRPRVPRAHR